MSGRAEGGNIEVVVVPTSAANVASVMAAMGRAGALARIAESERDVSDGALVVVPGVGSFGAAMGALRADGTDRAIGARVREGRATLGICLGMQVMFESSEESPGVAGLGVVAGRVERFGNKSQILTLKSQIEDTGCPGRYPVVRESTDRSEQRSVARVPQMGWNQVEVIPRAELFESGDARSPDRSEQKSVARIIRSGAAYFANSFRVSEAPEGWGAAMAEHGGRFVAGMERGAVVLCQFHPELSGAWGLGLIRRWIAKGLEGARC